MSMSNKKLSELIIKYLNDITTDVQREELVGYLENPIIRNDFKKYLSLNYFIIKDASQFEYKYPLRKAMSKIEKEKQQKGKVKIIRMRSVLRYAVASVILILGSNYCFKNIIFNNPDKNVPTIVNTKIIEPGTDKATLTLGDGSHIALEKGKSFQTGNAKSNGEEIVYNTQKQKATEITYNYLTIPRGGQYYVKLSDGTEVWLNSESQLKYPITFVEGESREVELIYGEAYFVVSPSTENGGSNFKVLNQNQEVEVLGTEFNIKAYLEDDYIYTTLVEGKVVVANATQKEVLKSSEQARLNTKDKGFVISQVDTFSETSWRKGIFSFKGMPLKEIMTVLSRWYDVDVVFTKPELENIKFNGVLNKNEEIEEILTIIKNSNFINAYDITDKKITIK